MNKFLKAAAAVGTTIGGIGTGLSVYFYKTQMEADEKFKKESDAFQKETAELQKEIDRYKKENRKKDVYFSLMEKFEQNGIRDHLNKITAYYNTTINTNRDAWIQKVQNNDKKTLAELDRLDASRHAVNFFFKQFATAYDFGWIDINMTRTWPSRSAVHRYLTHTQTLDEANCIRLPDCTWPDKAPTEYKTMKKFYEDKEAAINQAKASPDQGANATSAQTVASN